MSCDNITHMVRISPSVWQSSAFSPVKYTCSLYLF